MGTVYLLNEINLDGSPSDLYKIGKTKHEEVKKRTSGYKAGNARELRCIYQIETSNAQATETQLHREFDHYRITGAGGGDEWFQFPESNLPINVMQGFGVGAMTPQPRRDLNATISDLFTWAIAKIDQNKGIAALSMAVTAAIMGPNVAIVVILVFIGMIGFVKSDAPAGAK
jgi:Meiotically up-regulated gene 113